MRAILLANSQLNPSDTLADELHSGELLIAADGGGQHCLNLGLSPDIVVGDFDSLAPEALKQLAAGGARIVRHDTRKDETDLELALRLACDAGADDIIMFAALGNRWDMTLANLLLAAQAEFLDSRITLVDGAQRISLLKPGATHTLTGRTGDTLSLIPLAGDVSGIRTDGLEYPLEGETLHFGSPRGVSNVFLTTKATVFFEEGLLLAVQIQQR